MVDYVADINQFATIAQLKTVMEEANVLMRKAVGIFSEHKERGSLGEYHDSLIHWFTYRNILLRSDVRRIFFNHKRRARGTADGIY